MTVPTEQIILCNQMMVGTIWLAKNMDSENYKKHCKLKLKFANNIFYGIGIIAANEKREQVSNRRRRLPWTPEEVSSALPGC